MDNDIFTSSTFYLVLEFFLLDNGYIENGIYYFYLRDHLGNNCVVGSNTGAMKQWTHYYPYGKPIENENSNSSAQPYKFGGKEQETMFGLDMYVFHARQMDYRTGSFLTVDPLAEKCYSISPYAYCHDNPILRVDTTGKTDYVYGDGSPYTRTDDGNHEAVVNIGSLPEVVVTGKAPESVAQKIGDAGHAVVNGLESAQHYVKENKESFLVVSNGLQEIGGNMEKGGLIIAAYGSTVEGVGAAPGLTLAATGSVMSLAGETSEAVINIAAGDYKEGFVGIGKVVIGALVGNSMDRFLPVSPNGVTQDVKDATETAKQVIVSTSEEKSKDVLDK